MSRSRPPVLTVTPYAQDRLRVLLTQRSKPSLGIRIGTRARGCNGQSYTLEYADSCHPLDEKVVYGDLTIYIDPKALLHLMGTLMDYKEDDLETGFIFSNPNEKGRCGCGESFHV
jgi:iron-sulfur cluster assembly protein